MSNFFIVGMILFCAVNAYSQLTSETNSNYSISKPYEQYGPIRGYFHKDGMFYSAKYGGGKFYFQKYDIELMKEVEVEMEPKFGGFYPESFIEFGGRFYFIYSQWSKAGRVERLLAREIIFSKDIYFGEEKLLLESPEKVSGAVAIGEPNEDYRYYSKGIDEPQIAYDLTKSPDGNYLLIDYQGRNFKIDATQKSNLQVYVFDKDLNLKWNSEIKKPADEKYMTRFGSVVSNEGSATFLLNLDVYTISSDGSNTSVSQYKLNHKYLIDAGITINEKDEIIIAGYYGDKKIDVSEGIFILRLDDDGQIDIKKEFSIPKEIIEKYGDSDGELEDLELRDLILDQNGAISIYGETHNPVRMHTPNTINGSVSGNYFGEIIITCINSENEVSLIDKLPKRQVGGTRMEIGYFLFRNKEIHCLVLVDSENNKNLPFDQRPEPYRECTEGNLVGFIINQETKEIKRSTVVDLKNVKGSPLYDIQLIRMHQLSDTEMIIECNRKEKGDAFLKIQW